MYLVINTIVNLYLYIVNTSCRGPEPHLGAAHAGGLPGARRGRPKGP